MSMNVPQGGEEDQAVAEINVTPLVDVMLVLLIIFLITVPVSKIAQPVELPKITNIETSSKPQNVELSITASGEVWEGARRFGSQTELKEYIKTRAVETPQPEVHVRADRQTLYGNVGRAIYAVQQGGIIKVAFITEPPPRQ